MPQHILLNAFTLAAPSHLSMGLWRHPRDRSLQYNTLNYWTDLARLAERGLFDGIFIADGISLYDVYQGSAAPAIRAGVQFPRLDPMLLVSAMAAVTHDIGFGITSSVSYETPYLFARRMTTLDHITNGRVGWNIVTSFGDSGTQALGGSGAKPHHDRYALADDYLQLVYKYWEASWEDSAVVRDRASGVFANPQKIHRVHHHSDFFDSDGIFVSEPSPQRTPVLFQAGASSRGRDFAAQHAECVFISAPSKKVARGIVEDVRRRAQTYGRQGSDIRFFLQLAVIPAATDEAAHAKLDEYRQYVNLEGSAALFSRWTGIDLAQYGLDEPLRHIQTNHLQSAVDAYTSADPDRSWTIREILERVSIGGGSGDLLVGSPSTIADGMQAWVQETGIDGFNLGYVTAHESLQDFIEWVVPELQHRGIYKQRYTEGTLRNKLFGTTRLPANHPGAQVRGSLQEPVETTTPATK